MAFWRRLALASLVICSAGIPTCQMASTCAATTAVGQEHAPALRVLPAGPIGGWQMREAPRSYTPENLYEYIDGNADLFLSYGFVDLAVGDYVPADGEGWISVDVYDMGTRLNAFGAFTSERPEGVELSPIGAQGYAADGLVAFWKGPYYVKASLVDGSSIAAALKLAEVTAERIADEPVMPAELGRLPIEGRVPASERYDKTSALGHKFLVEVVSADYHLGDTTVRLSIADLGAPDKAAEGLAKLREFEGSTGAAVVSINGVGDDGFAVRDPYYGEMVVARTDRFIAIGVSERAKREAVRELVTAGLASATAATANARPRGPAVHQS